MANKLYLLSYISETIQQYATDMLLSAVNQQISDAELSECGSCDQRLEGEVLNPCVVLFGNLSGFFLCFILTFGIIRVD